MSEDELPIGTVVEYDFRNLGKVFIVAQKVDHSQWKILHKYPLKNVKKFKLEDFTGFTDKDSTFRDNVLKNGLLIYG